MAGGIYFFDAIVARSRFTNELLILDVGERVRGAIDGPFASDNSFSNIELIPNTPGIWKVGCKLYWTDGDYGAMCERGDPDFEITILDVTTMSLDEMIAITHN